VTAARVQTRTAPDGLGEPRRPRLRARGARPLRVLAVAMVLVGAIAVADAFVTLVWQEPFSALYASLRQSHLAGDLARVEKTAPSAPERTKLASLADEQRRIAFLAGQFEHRARNGGAVGWISIPSIGASYVVVKGTDTEDLESGPGIYSETRFPGGSGTTAIAGHRTTYLAPFRHIDALRHGNVIRLRMPYAEFTYLVVGQRIVAPTDVAAAVSEVGYPRLVLSACTPLFTAEKRLLVYARLIRTVPRGAARELPGGALPRPIEAQPARAALPRPLPPVFVPLDPNVLSALV
jgi:sortase A